MSKREVSFVNYSHLKNLLKGKILSVITFACANLCLYAVMKKT